MRPFNGAKAERRAQREILPAGGYVAKILDAKEVEYSWGTVLLVSFDIAEGEHKDFSAGTTTPSSRRTRSGAVHAVW
ncbi:MAG: hypothetical protein ACLU8W_05690 [Clostridia bacterium]